MKKLQECLFQAICLCFSAALLVLTLLCSIRLAAVSDQTLRMQREADRLRDENAILRSRYEQSVSLEEIERRAREELGMQSLSAEQIVRTDFAG